MIIYIQENQLITEKEISKDIKAELLGQGFQEVLVLDVEIPSDYKYEHFEVVDGIWRLKEE